MPLKFISWLTGKLSPKPTPGALPAPIPTAPRGRKKGSEADAVRKLVLSGGAPDDLSTGRLDLSEVNEPFQLPPRLQCFELILSGSTIAALPPGIRVANRIDLTGCTALQSLPAGLKTGTLILQDCTALTALPENLDVHFLTLDGCRALAHWPESARVTLGRISAKRCAALGALPSTLGPVTSLDLSGCSQIKAIPAGVQVTSWLDLNGTGVRQLPESLSGVHLR